MASALTPRQEPPDISHFQQRAADLQKQGQDLGKYDVVKKGGKFVLNEISVRQRLWRSLFGPNITHIKNITEIATIAKGGLEKGQKSLNPIALGSALTKLLEKVVTQIQVPTENAILGAAFEALNELQRTSVKKRPEAQIMNEMNIALDRLKKPNPPVQKIVQQYLPNINELLGSLPPKERDALKNNPEFQLLRNTLLGLIGDTLKKTPQSVERLKVSCTSIRNPEKPLSLRAIPVATPTQQADKTYQKYNALITKWQGKIPNAEAVRQTLGREANLETFQIGGKGLPANEVAEIEQLVSKRTVTSNSSFIEWARVALIADSLEQTMATQWATATPKPTEAQIQQAVGDLLQATTIDHNPMSGLAEVSGMIALAYPLEEMETTLSLTGRDPVHQPDHRYIFTIEQDAQKKPTCGLQTVCHYQLYDTTQLKDDEMERNRENGIKQIERWSPKLGQEVVVSTSLSRAIDATSLTGTVTTTNLSLPITKIMTSMESAIQALQQENPPIQTIIKKHIPSINEIMQNLKREEYRQLLADPKYIEMKETLTSLLKEKLKGAQGVEEPITLDIAALRAKVASKKLPPLSSVAEKANPNYRHFNQLIKKWQKYIPNPDAVRNTLGRERLEDIQIAGKGIPQTEIERLSTMQQALGLSPNDLFPSWAQTALIADSIESAMREQWKGLDAQPSDEDIRKAVGDLLQASTMDHNPIGTLSEIQGLTPDVRISSTQPQSRFVYEFTTDPQDQPICTVKRDFHYLVHDDLSPSGKEISVATTLSRPLSEETSFTGTVTTTQVP